jgi:CRISPR-associated protein Csm4
MTTWRVRLRPLAPWATPFRSDSLFGAICWRWLELFPETFESMLDAFRETGDPPFVLSDALPGDFMPVPMSAKLPPLDKKMKPPLYISEACFREIMQGGTAAASGIRAKAICASTRVQTAIDRDIGTAAEGQLFETGTQHLAHELELLTVYIRCERYLEQLMACFQALAWTGFGKKSSTGLGAFEIASAPEPCEWLDHCSGANAFMALSHFVPAPGDPSRGRWRTQVTFPKFHGNSVTNVFKGSMVMLSPGSVFRTDDGPPAPWYGCMIPVPRPEMAKALHYALCFPAPLVWPAEAA